MSLLSHYGFDLREWLHGRDNRSPHTILAMVRNLPPDSLLSAKLSAQHEVMMQRLKAELPEGDFEEMQKSLEPEDEVERLTREKMAWTLPNTLLAMQVNQLSPGDKAVVGPSAWIDEKDDKAEESESAIAKFFKNKMGGMNGS